MAWHVKVWPGLFLLLFSFVVRSEVTAKPEYRYETAYACEGKTLKIECKEGELIKLIRANYGRFSITICNDHGNTDWSVNCMSPKSLRVLHSRCTQYQNCSIPASTSMFGDPCPGTHKYLEAHYQCLPATITTTTSRPTPPWLITSQPPMWSTLKPSSRPSPSPAKVSATPVSAQTQGPAVAVVTSTAPKSSSTVLNILPQQSVPATNDDDPEELDVPIINKGIPDEITTLPFTTVLPKKSISESTVPYTFMPSSSASPAWIQNTSPIAHHCSPTTVRSIYWNYTKTNTTSVQPCPGGTTGFAKWHCSEMQDGVPQWSPQTPDLSECRSVWLTSLEQRILAGKEPLPSITSDLAQVTNSKTLYGGDMMITTKIIQKMTQKMSHDILTFPDTGQREAYVTDMLMDVAKTGSNLLDASQHPSWRDLSYKEQMSVATSLLIGLEENAFLLADTVTSQKTVDSRFKNILLSVRVLDTKSLTNERFPSGGKSQWTVSNDSVELPKDALLENSDGNLVRIVFVSFDRLEEILQWQPDASGEANNANSNNNNVTKILNSKVISASLGKGRHIQLKEPVKLTLKHLKTENVSNPTCVFWDYTTNSWSEEGCHVQLSQSNDTHTVCLCDHLTNFAILMDVRSIYLPIQHEIALQVITYVGCIVSIICLILAIITFQLFRGLKSDRTTVHCNLCVCLLIAEFLFITGIGQTDNRIVCGVIAGFLQYFFLCAFLWMFIEGFQLYVMLIEVFEAEKSRMRWYYIFAYGLPLVIVSVSVAIRPQGYGTDRHCWLQTNNNFIYSFVGPVIVVILLNFIFLTMAIVMMCKHASASVSLKNKEHSRLASTSGKEENALQIKFQAHLAWLKGAFVLIFLLGLTWTFAFLYLNQESVAMAYAFAALNSLQGFFIFFFHCVQNEKVRKEYRKFIRRHSWLPKCLRCSKAAGNASGSSSSGLAKERRTSLYAGSNGNPSGSNSHSVDNALSPHGTSLKRGWNTRSCGNVNRACRTPVTTSTSANMAVTLSHPTRVANTTLNPDLNNSFIEPNTSTLPYIRNIAKNSNFSSNIPKSVSTWGPLHKPVHWKNISFKPYSRDSGHGGSEQEDSPRSHQVTTDVQLLNTKDSRQRQIYMSAVADQMQQLQQQQQPSGGIISQHGTFQHPKHLPLPQSLNQRKKNMNLKSGGGHWGYHTYTEIYDKNRVLQEDDPVYEEIERNEIQVSDMSDEDGRRQSDMSRQSSRSYGDHRPLIPYSPGIDQHNLLMDVMKNNELDSYRAMRTNMYQRGDPVHSLAAVLDGETVVCHLEPPEMYPCEFVAQNVLPPYSES